MNKKMFIVLSLVSGIILSFGWLKWGSGLPLLVAFIPLLWIEEQLHASKEQNRSVVIFKYPFIAFTTWNLINTFWLWNASPVGLFLAVLVNATMFSIIFWLFHIIKRNTGAITGYLSLIAFWVYWEYFYMHGEITWPWLNLGNGFAHDVRLIQWYEYTGTLGGSFWIILVNVMIFWLIRSYTREGSLRKHKPVTMLTLLVVFLPMIISLAIFGSYKEKKDPYNIVVVQPNIDPYNEKFFGMDPQLQAIKLLKLADSLTDDSTDYIVAPETALNNDIWLNTIHQNPTIRLVENVMHKHPRARMVIGITAYRRYAPGEKHTETAKTLDNYGNYYDSYNAAIQIDSTGNIQDYYKSMLVVGVEKMPYTRYLQFLKKLTLRLGGTFRSHATQEYRENLYAPDSSVCVAPVICYESVFGEYCTDYIKAGANFIFIITNDGWWGNTPGHRQHNAFAALRAVETRRSVARSANTGISSFFNQRGEMLQATAYWVPDVIKATLNANDKLTFYVRHGDYIPRFLGWISGVSLLYLVFHLLFLKKK
jgi:apolipoprotein N-acyltransferase